MTAQTKPGRRPAVPGEDPRLCALRAELRKITAIKDPRKRWDYLDAALRDGPNPERRPARNVWHAAGATADDFSRHDLKGVESWALPVLRELVVRPPLGGVMSVTKLRAIDARIRREARAANRTDGTDGTNRTDEGRQS